MTCAPTQDEFLKPLKIVNGSYAPCGAGGEEHSGGRPDVNRKFLNSKFIFFIPIIIVKISARTYVRYAGVSKVHSRMHVRFLMQGIMHDSYCNPHFSYQQNFCDMTCALSQDEFLKPLKVVNGSYAPSGAGGEEHSGGRPDVKRKFLHSYWRPKP